MEPMDEEAPSIVNLPMEIIYKILLFLPTIELMKMRFICRVWRAAVDALTSRDDTWQQLCARDHAATYRQARSKCIKGLTWCQLYQSLHLWTKLDLAEVSWAELVSFDEAKIDTLHLYKDFLVVLGRNKVVYCNKETLEPKSRLTIGGAELFTENENVAAYLSFSDPHWSQMSDLKIVPKRNDKLVLDSTVTVEDVCNFTVVGTDVYYDKSIRDIFKIYVCKSSDSYNSTELITVPLPVWGLSYYENCLHIMLGGYNVYKVHDNTLVHVKDEDNIFKTLKYGFQITDFDYETKLDIATSLGINYLIYKLFVYKNLIFTGSQQGVLRVYNAEVIAKEPKTDPIVKYDFAEIFQIEEDDLPIRGIDVMERDKGHIVYVSTSKKIFTLNLTH